MTNKIIVAGLVIVAFVIGTISVNPLAEAANPLLEQIQITVDAIKTDTVEIQTIKNNQYVPFQTPSTIPFLSSEICDTAGGSGQQQNLRINGDSDFIVTGITFQPTGLDQATDEIVIVAIFVDNQKLAVNTGDITGTSPVSFGFDIAGLPTVTGGKLPTTIVAVGDGPQDIAISFSCFADTTSDITFPEGSIVVSGWKLASDTITAQYD